MHVFMEACMHNIHVCVLVYLVRYTRYSNKRMLKPTVR